MRKCVCIAVLAAISLLVCSIPARAQLYEDVGTRAQGMSGAFVAVADDATAVWWNPAGLATGALFGAILERGRVTAPEDPTLPGPARRAGVTGFSLAFPALGLSYYRLRISEMPASHPTESLSPDRQDDGGARVRSRALNQFGITVGQSMWDHVVAGTTVKVVRGGGGSGSVDPTRDLLDQGDKLDFSSETHVDLDAGLMVAFSHARAGLTVRNLTTPEFGDGNERFELKRQARAGLALLATSPGLVQELTVSADADLTRTATPFGDVRHAALGGEAWLVKRRLAVRGGVAANTIGERRTTTSAGASVKAISRLYIDVARTFGSDGSVRGWSTTARISF